MKSEKDVECKPFKKRHFERLGLVTDFEWIDFDKLDGVGNIIDEIVSDNRCTKFIDAVCIIAINASIELGIAVLRSWHRQNRFQNVRGLLHM